MCRPTEATYPPCSARQCCHVYRDSGAAYKTTHLLTYLLVVCRIVIFATNACIVRFYSLRHKIRDGGIKFFGRPSVRPAGRPLSVVHVARYLCNVLRERISTELGTDIHHVIGQFQGQRSRSEVKVICVHCTMYSSAVNAMAAEAYILRV